jgi:hypothetical protein
MIILSISVIIFLVIIGLLIYVNWPTKSAAFTTPCGCGGRGCANCPCNRCGMPRRRCGCQAPSSSGGCPFC